MNHRPAILANLLLSLPLAASLLGATANASAQTNGSAFSAEERDHAPSCTLKTLKGRYLFASSGTLLPPAFGVTEPTPGADAGYHTFNGDGTGTDTVTVRIGSQVFLENVVTPIIYTVNADCTGSYTVTVPNGPSFDLFIAPDGEAISRIATAPPGNSSQSIDRRVSPNDHRERW